MGRDDSRAWAASQPGPPSYTLLFYVDAATTLVYALVVALRVPETRPSVSPTSVTRASSKVESAPRFASSKVLSDRRFVAFLALTFLLALVFSQVLFTLPLYLKSIGFGEQVFGTLMAVNGILIVIAQPIVVRLTRHTSAELVFVCAALLQGVGVGLHGASSAGWVQLVALVIWTLGEIATVPIAVTVVATFAPHAARGRYQGAYAAVWSLAIACGPLFGGLVLSRLGASVLWSSCLGLGVLTALLALMSGTLRPSSAVVTS